MESRRDFLKQATAAAGLAMLPLAACTTNGGNANKPERPNIVLILTDDQGYGDVGCLGNPVLKTPNMDRLCREGAQLTHFHSSPVCSPTRACLLTGRYNYRLGVVDTYVGRSLMDPGAATLAEMLGDKGYHTGIFGKWHLGDNYPLRAMDQGFQESLVIKGGGLCQPSDPACTSYFDPLLKHNGADCPTKGYCTDVYTDAAVAFIEQHANEPFFAYLAVNAPHVPLQIDEKYWRPYADQGLDEKTAKVYGMVANIDENIGRVIASLDRLGIADNTMIIFMTDNGPAFGGTPRYNAEMRGEKGTVFEGGIRVPCFLRWPKVITPDTRVNTLAAHIDLTPTILEACGVTPPADIQFDGRSLLPLLRGDSTPWPSRNLFLQWHRGDAPEPFRNCAVLSQRFKLVDGKELYDLDNDPGETTDIAAEHPDIVQPMRAAYKEWFASLVNGRGFAPPRIILGDDHDNPSVLTRQDWRGTDSWSDDALGWWEVDVRPGRYQFTATYPKAKGEAVISLKGVSLKQPLEQGRAVAIFPEAGAPGGPGRLETWVVDGDKRIGAVTVQVKRL